MAEPAPVVLLQFIARREQDGTYSLCLDNTGSADPAYILGANYESPADVVKVLAEALTAPAVAEERMTAVEEYLPALNQTIDAVNASSDGLTALNDRIRELEAFRDEMERAGFNLPTRPAIPRVPRPGQQQPTGLRRSTGPIEPPLVYEEPIIPAGRRPGRSIVGPSSLDEPRPDFNRGEFKPHQPVARVGRGPNTVD